MTDPENPVVEVVEDGFVTETEPCEFTIDGSITEQDYPEPINLKECDINKIVFNFSEQNPAVVFFKYQELTGDIAVYLDDPTKERGIDESPPHALFVIDVPEGFNPEDVSFSAIDAAGNEVSLEHKTPTVGFYVSNDEQVMAADQKATLEPPKLN